MEDQQISHTEEQVHNADQKLQSRLQKLTEQIKKFSKPKYVQLAAIGILVLSVPLTVVLSMRQQDIRQQAAEKKFSDPKYIGSLPPFNDLVDLENQLVAGHKDSPFKIQQSDYNKCPNAVPNQPGWWDKSTVANVSCDDIWCGDSASQDEKDPIWFFGKVIDGTDPVNDPFYTAGKPNGEARWAGNPRHSVANPHDRGNGYSYGEYVPGVLRVGGWSWEWDKDHACWGISTYGCSLDGNKMPTGGGRNGYARAMGWASNAINHSRTGTTLKNRECILAIAVMETRQEWLRNIGEEDSPMRNVNASLRNPEATGFYLGSSTGSKDTTSPGTTLRDVVNTSADDKNSCKDHTFADVPSTDTELQNAATCLGTKTACTVRGFEDGTLQADVTATRAYVAAFIARYHVYVLKDWEFVNLSNLPESSLYTDIPKNYGLALEIYTAREKGLLNKSLTTFNPDDPWLFGFKGPSPSGYDFSSPGTQMTRGEFIKAVYAYGTTGAGKGQLSCGSAAVPSGGALKDPTPFVEAASDAENRVKVCGEKASLLTGHITGEPSVRAFKDGLYVFAKGREDKVYVRRLTPTVNADGTLANLANSPWTDMGKTIAGDVITYLQNQEGLPSLSAIVTDKKDGKTYISSTTGDSFSTWIENKQSHNSSMQMLRFTSVNNMTFGFKMGDESSENNLCMSIAAFPVSGSAGGNQPGGGDASPSPANPAETEPVTGSGEPFASCVSRFGSTGVSVCCRTNPAYAEESACKQRAAELASDPNTGSEDLDGCIVAKQQSLGDEWSIGRAKGECCSIPAYKSLSACALPAPGTGLRTAPNQNLFQQFLSWLSSIF